jgi:DNA-binding LacI/PurR family transcriptional regulator
MSTRTRRTRNEYCQRLRDIALEKGPGAKLPTTRELSGLLDIDLRTLTSVLNDLEAENVIIRRDRSGLYVSPRIHRKTIAVVFNAHLMGADSSPFWGMLLSRFAEEAAVRAQHADQDLEFYITSPQSEPHADLPEHVKKAVRMGAIDGVVAISLSRESADWLGEQGVPCVAYAGGAKWTVVTDSEQIIFTGLRLLADQGCRRIAYWGLARPGDENSKWYADLCRTLEAAYRRLGLEPPETVIGPARELWATTLPADTEHALRYRGYAAARALFEDPDRPHPDGLFIDDDMMASQVLLGLTQIGVRPGIDVKIVASANRNSPILFGHEGHLTRLELDPAEIAGSLMRLLECAMDDPDTPEIEIGVPRMVRFPGE